MQRLSGFVASEQYAILLLTSDRTCIKPRKIVLRKKLSGIGARPVKKGIYKMKCTFNQIPEYSGHDFENFLATDSCQDLGRDGQDVGAAHDGAGFVPIAVDGVLSPPGLRVIQDVVVEQ